MITFTSNLEDLERQRLISHSHYIELIKIADKLDVIGFFYDAARFAYTVKRIGHNFFQIEAQLLAREYISNDEYITSLDRTNFVAVVFSEYNAMSVATMLINDRIAENKRQHII